MVAGDAVGEPSPPTRSASRFQLVRSRASNSSRACAGVARPARSGRHRSAVGPRRRPVGTVAVVADLQHSPQHSVKRRPSRTPAWRRASADRRCQTPVHEPVADQRRPRSKNLVASVPAKMIPARRCALPRTRGCLMKSVVVMAGRRASRAAAASPAKDAHGLRRKRALRISP